MHQPARDGVYNVSMTTIPAGRSLSTSNVSVTDSSLVTRATYKITFGPVVAGATAGTSSTSYIIEEIPATGDLPTFPGPPYQVGPFTVPDDLLRQARIGTDCRPGRPTRQSTGMPGLSLTITGTPAAGDVITVDPNPSIFSVMDDAIRDIGGAVNTNAASQAVGQAIITLISA